MGGTGTDLAGSGAGTRCSAEGTRSSWVDKLLVILLAGLVLGLLCTVTWKASQAKADSGGSSCDEATSEPTPLASGAVAPEDIPAVGEQGQLQVRDMGRDRDRITLRTFLRLSGPLPAKVVPPEEDGTPRDVVYLNVQAGPFQREDGVQMEPEHVVATAQVSMAGRREILVLTVCVDPVVVTSGNDEPRYAKPGGYTGTVYVDDPRVTGGTGTYTVNMKYKPITAVLAVVGWGGLLGALVGLALASGVSWDTLWQNVGRTLSAIIAGVVALYTVYVAQYDNDPSWQGDTSLFIALFATSVGSVYAAVHVAGTLNVVPAKERRVGD